MLSPMWIILLTIAYLESGIAITLNTYIVMANVKSINHGQRLNQSELIHVVMGLVNIILQCFLTVQGSLYVTCVTMFFNKEIFLSFTIIILTMIYCSFWSTAWLCAYYCTRITNFRSGLCVWLKRISSTSQMLLLLLSAVGSFLISFLCIWDTKVENEEQSSENSTLGTSFVSGTLLFNQLNALIATFLGCILPFLLILFSIILTFSSLLRHVCKIKQNDSGFTRPKLQAHINAIRTIILLLILFVALCLAQFVNLKFKSTSSLDIMPIISWFIIMSYPTAEAIIVIQANSRLKKIFVEKLRALFWRNMKTEN